MQDVHLECKIIGDLVPNRSLLLPNQRQPSNNRRSLADMLEPILLPGSSSRDCPSFVLISDPSVLLRIRS